MRINREKQMQHSIPSSLYQIVFCRFVVVLVQHETEGVLLHIQVLVTSVNKSICSTVRSDWSWNITSSSSFLPTEPSSVSCTGWLCVSWSNVFGGWCVASWWRFYGAPSGIHRTLFCSCSTTVTIWVQMSETLPAWTTPATQGGGVRVGYQTF